MPRDEAYKQAEQKIAEALKTGATKLALSGMELTELPDSLGQLTQLQSLNLSHNQLTTLPGRWLRLVRSRNCGIWILWTTN